MQLHLSIPDEDATALERVAAAWRCRRATASRGLIAEALQARGLIMEAPGTERPRAGRTRKRGQRA